MLTILLIFKLKPVMATLQMGDTTFEKGDTETEKAPYFRGFGGYPELFKSCFPHQALKTLCFRAFSFSEFPFLCARYCGEFLKSNPLKEVKRQRCSPALRQAIFVPFTGTCAVLPEMLLHSNFQNLDRKSWRICRPGRRGESLCPACGKVSVAS